MFDVQGAGRWPRSNLRTFGLGEGAVVQGVGTNPRTDISAWEMAAGGQIGLAKPTVLGKVGYYKQQKPAAEVWLFASRPSSVGRRPDSLGAFVSVLFGRGVGRVGGPQLWDASLLRGDRRACSPARC